MKQPKLTDWYLIWFTKQKRLAYLDNTIYLGLSQTWEGTVVPTNNNKVAEYTNKKAVSNKGCFKLINLTKSQLVDLHLSNHTLKNLIELSSKNIYPWNELYILLDPKRNKLTKVIPGRKA